MGSRRVSFSSVEEVRYFVSDGVDVADSSDRLAACTFESNSDTSDGSVESCDSREEEEDEVEVLHEALAKADERRSQKCSAGWSMQMEVTLTPDFSSSLIGRRRRIGAIHPRV
mmetsp:Transcript_17312/g.40307  ORF Transcript_17312/g.40307 Transcript_17312/m.40307 type:complete len:113 (-) Transcript_17312:126-464(-)